LNPLIHPLSNYVIQYTPGLEKGCKKINHIIKNFFPVKYLMFYFKRILINHFFKIVIKVRGRPKSLVAIRSWKYKNLSFFVEEILLINQNPLLCALTLKLLFNGYIDAAPLPLSTILYVPKFSSVGEGRRPRAKRRVVLHRVK